MHLQHYAASAFLSSATCCVEDTSEDSHMIPNTHTLGPTMMHLDEAPLWIIRIRHTPIARSAGGILVLPE